MNSIVDVGNTKFFICNEMGIWVGGFG
jgi:hypothetical protein